MRALRRLLLLLALATPVASGATTFVYLASEGPDEPVLNGRRLRVMDEMDDFASFIVYTNPDGSLVLGVLEPELRSRDWLYFIPPPGQHFAPGSYEGAADCGLSTRPGLCVEHEYYGQPASAHFTVLDAAYDATGTLVRFAADFAQRGAASGTELTGSIRFASGDSTCAGVADGTPCDDLDACSASSACAGGKCVASQAVTCDGPPAGQCHDGPACDPAAGTCHPPTFWSDTFSCRPEDRCASFGVCHAGICRLDTPLFCADYDACTYDTCDTHTGCVYTPIPGACGRPGLPAAYVFVRRTPLGPPGATPPAVALVSNNVNAQVYGTDSATASAFDPNAGFWSFTFAPPPGSPLVPGVYENATPFTGSTEPGRPVLSISPSVVDCAAPVGRFVVHQIGARFLEGDRGQATMLAVDFEQRCDADGSAFAGVVRYRAGDAACIGAADGAPCDDLNACTTTSTCQGGTCVGADPVVCAPTGDGCHAQPVCDPTTGACADPPALADGTLCDDPSACVAGGTCQDGTCVPPERPCNDGNPCTADGCDPVDGCQHSGIPGCWLTAAKVSLTASASGSLQGHSVQCGPVRCKRISEGIILIPGDGSYRRPSGRVTCRDGDTITLPEEIGTLRPTRSGKLRVKPSNLADVLRALRQCQRRRITVSRREWIRLSADGQSFTSVTRSHVTFFDKIPLQEQSIARETGRLSTFPDPIELLPNEHACPEPLQLRCFER